MKPAHEPLVLARKPLIGTVAQNVLEHGTGALNIDGCRIEGEGNLVRPAISRHENEVFGKGLGVGVQTEPQGRWPANFIHDGSNEVLALFPETGPSKASMRGVGLTASEEKVFGKGDPEFDTLRGHNDSGGSAARFFYTAKASRKDRGEGNLHPTVKPTDLMRYLVRLITPPGGTVLDPFCGSGSTGKAAVLEGFAFIGIELDAEYVEIARARIAATQPALLGETA